MLQPQLSSLCHLSILGVLAAGGIWPTASLAQITPDGSLGPAGSQVTPGAPIGGQPADLIEGGTQHGANLFHSFSDFNVGDLQRVYFANPAGVQNILTRVTGPNPSNILGTLGVTGAANLFLLNPHGILFGPNAQLDLRGSFLASTADSLTFDNGFAFSARNPQAPPLLTVNVPIGLQYGNRAGTIRVQGNGQELREFVANAPLIDTTMGLQVPFDQTLALVGGEIALEGATLKTAGGRIELGSIADNSLVSLTPTGKGFALGYDAVQNFGAIQLSQKSYVDASGEGGGDIVIQGGRVILAGGSTIEASTLRAKPGGNFIINARLSLEVIGGDTLAEESGLFAITYPKTTGAGGNLTINTPNLLVRNGGEISVSTFAEGNSGDIIINAPQSLQLIGTSGDGQVRSGVFARANGTIGSAGNVTLNTGTLIIRDGAQISVGTRSAGNGGNLMINAAQGIALIGTFAEQEFSSGLYAQANSGASGSGGNLTIDTPTLLVQDGAVIAGGTFGAGFAGSIAINAPQGIHLIGTSPSGEQSSGLFLFAARESTGAGGDLTINTSDLLVENGAAVSVGTNGGGKAGTLTVNATGSVKAIGSSLDGRYPSALFASAGSGSTGGAGKLVINTPSLFVQNGAEISAATSGAGDGGELIVNAPNLVQVSGSDFTGRVSALRTLTQGSGNGGELAIFTTMLQVQNKAEIAVGSTGTGRSGNLQIQANSINLDNQAALSASTTSDRSGNQANISLTAKNLVLRRNSNITTNATGNATGGNISITSDFIVSAPNENNDITTNAFAGSGGQITLAARNIFWFDQRTRPDLQRLLNTTNPADLDPGRLPTNDITAFSQANPIIDTGAVTVQTPGLDPTQGITALPTSLIDPSRLMASTCAADRGSSFTITGRGGIPEDPRQPLLGAAIWRDDRGGVSNQGAAPAPPTEAIVEAQGWIVDRSGTIVLVAGPPRRHPAWHPPCALPQ